MKKIMLINILAFAAILVVLLSSTDVKEQKVCNSHCCTKQKAADQKMIKAEGGADTDEQLFQFNRVYIKM
jgi:hypothetical protein